MPIKQYTSIAFAPLPGLKVTTKPVWPLSAVGLPGVPGVPTTSSADSGDVAMPTPLTLLQVCIQAQGHEPQAMTLQPQLLACLNTGAAGCLLHFQRVPCAAAPDFALELAGGCVCPGVHLLASISTSTGRQGGKAHWRRLVHVAVLVLQYEDICDSSIGAGERKVEGDGAGSKRQGGRARRDRCTCMCGL